jgi:hypothetical protein
MCFRNHVWAWTRRPCPSKPPGSNPTGVLTFLCEVFKEASTPFNSTCTKRVEFGAGYYSQLIALYKHLGIRFHRIDFSYSFSLLTSPSRLRLIWATGRTTVSMPSTLQGSKLATKGRPSTFQTYGAVILRSMHLLFCYLWLLWLSLPFTRFEGLETMSLRQWSEIAVPKNSIAKWMGLDEAWREFTSAMLVPFWSAICTAPGEDIWNHPAEELLGKLSTEIGNMRRN